MFEMGIARLLANYIASKTGDSQVITDHLPPEYQPAVAAPVQSEEEMRQEAASYATHVTMAGGK